MNRKKLNEDGSFKQEYLQELIADNRHPELIEKHAQVFKNRYVELKHLDETDPEPWPVYTAYDFFTPEEKQEFNPDGTLKSEYIETALSKGISENWLAEMERRKKIEVDNYNKMSASHAEQGINYGAWLMRSLMPTNGTYPQRIKQMEVDLRNNEEPSSLPFDKDTSYF